MKDNDLTDTQKGLSSEARLSNLILESIRDYAIFTTDPAGNLTSWRAASESILGYSEIEILGKNAAIFFTPEDILAGAPEQELQKAISQGSAEDERWHVRKDRSRFWGSGRTTPLLNETDEVIGFVKIMRDLTQQKQSIDLLASQAIELTRSNAELENFASLVSHDLQEPLVMVRTFSESLMNRYRDKLDESALDSFNYIIEAIDSMQQLIKNMLALSRPNSQGAGSFRKVDSQKILERAATNLLVLISKNNVELDYGNLPNISCDPVQLTQVFQNLITNAIKFRRSDVRLNICVSADELGHEWQFCVSDNGIGIAPENLTKIFETYQRGHAFSQVPGNGLGLAICKKIIESHQGRIWAHSQPGTGSKFFFTIPKS